ncbi:hypothetical protein BH09GEM1_BH09GEM1_45260 [soil metagenome]
MVRILPKARDILRGKTEQIWMEKRERVLKEVAIHCSRVYAEVGKHPTQCIGPVFLQLEK